MKQLLCLFLLASADASAQVTNAIAPPGQPPYLFSAVDADPNGPTSVCVKNSLPTKPDYHCYGGLAIQGFVRAQSPEYLRQQADIIEKKKPPLCNAAVSFNYCRFGENRNKL